MHLLKKIFLYSFITIQYFLLYFSIHFKISLIQNCQFYQLNFISDELISFFFFFFSEHFSISFLSTSLFLLSITFEKIVIQSLFSILNDKKKKSVKSQVKREKSQSAWASALGRDPRTRHIPEEIARPSRKFNRPFSTAIWKSRLVKKTLGIN